MRNKGLALLVIIVFCIVSVVEAGNRNSGFSSSNYSKSNSNRFSSGGMTANGIGNGSGAGGGNGGTGTGVDNGSSNAGGQGNGGGATVPIGNGMWILLIGSTIFLGKKIYSEYRTSKHSNTQHSNI